MATRGGSRGAAQRGRGKSQAGAKPRAPPATRPAQRSRFAELADAPVVRAFVTHPNLSAALLLALPVLVYLWPVLVGGQVFAATSVLYSLPPWQHLSPPDLGNYFNLVLSDVPTADYPWRHYAREQIRSGSIPFWNPHVFAGTPFYSNPQTGIFSLFSLPIWILSLNYGIAVGAALKLWAGAFGCYLLVRELRLGFLPGLLAGVAFAFSALNITWLTHETLPAVAAMLPWMVWLIERLFGRGGGSRTMVGLAIVTAIGLGGGHPGMQLHVLLAAGLYALLRAGFMDSTERAWRLRPLGLALGGMVLGTLLMAVMLIPEALSARDTIGTSARRGGGGTLPGTIMPFDAIKTVLFPDWWGRPSAIEVTPQNQRSAAALVNYNERTFYAGMVALMLGAIALMARGDWRRKAPFVVLAAIGLAIPLHAPVLYWLMTHLPLLQEVQSQRMHFIFAFAVAVLAAFGMRAVVERPRERIRYGLVPMGAVAVGLIAIGSTGAAGADYGTVVKHFITGADSKDASVIAMTSVVWMLLFAGGVALAFLLLGRRPRWTAAIAAGIVVLAVVDGHHFAHGYQPMAPAEKAIPPITPAIEFLQRHADEGRFLGLEYTLLNDWGVVYGLNDVRGYDPPQPTERFYRLWRAAEPLQTDWQPFTFQSLTPASLRVASVLGARYIVAPPGSTMASDAAPPLRALKRVYSGVDATIFLNPFAAPRVLVVQDVRITDGEDETRADLLTEGFDPRRMAVVERAELPVDVSATISRGGHGRATLTEDKPGRVAVRATVTEPGLVIVNDRITEGWRLEVDGREATSLLVNQVMRGVVVTPGTHNLVWTYRVPGLRTGTTVTVMALAMLAAIAGAARVRRRRSA